MIERDGNRETTGLELAEKMGTKRDGDGNWERGGGSWE